MIDEVREVRKLMRPVLLSAQCPMNGCDGTMQARDSYTVGFNPTLTEHQCPKCYTKAVYPALYPRIVHEAVPEGGIV